MSEIKLQTGTRVFEVLAYLCHSPMEALKQFVENGADAIEQSGHVDGSIRVRLDHSSDSQNKASQIIVEDNGAGISPEKMRHILQNIGNSEKLEHILRGEKGVGILAFALLADELHLSSMCEGQAPSCLVLRKDWLREGRAEIVEQCPQHRLTRPGTRAHLMGILTEIAPQLTKARLKQYLSREFSNDLRRSIYTMQISDGHGYEAIEPRIFSGVPTLTSVFNLGDGCHASVQLYTLPFQAEGANIDLCGRAGIRLCALTDLEDFKKEPWLGQRLEGSIRCDKLSGTADKAAVVQDEIYKKLAESLRGIEPQLADKIGQVTQEYRQNRLTEIMRRVDRFIGYFLRYKETDEMPGIKMASVAERTGADLVQKLNLPEVRPVTKATVAGRATKNNHPAFLQADLCAPPEGRSQLRTWSDNGSSGVKINVLHSDFLSSEKDDKRCAWYLFSVWAKQQLLKEYGADPEALADEMVGLFSKAGPLLNQYAIHPRSNRHHDGKS